MSASGGVESVGSPIVSATRIHGYLVITALDACADLAELSHAKIVVKGYVASPPNACSCRTVFTVSTPFQSRSAAGQAPGYMSPQVQAGPQEPSAP